MEFAWKIDEGTNVRLKDYDPGYTDNRSSPDEAKQAMLALSGKLGDLQESLVAAQQASLLIVLQGMDTSGKDGTIRHVMGQVNPQGCYVHSFKEPTPEELGHDFLWRVHKVAPAKGMIGIFNRSHYEDVLVARVHNLVPKDVWQRRYKEINHFEKLLVNNGTIILKFFLHISKDEQERRLLAREQDKDKAWKLSASDWAERKFWDDYQQAYEDALAQCSTDEAPWYVVPSNHKWYRNLAVAHILEETMHQHKGTWQAELEARGQRELAVLEKVRQEQGR